MGALGFFGLRYPEKYGGSAMDTLASVVLARSSAKCSLAACRRRRLGPCRHGLAALARSAREAQNARWMPQDRLGRGHHRRRRRPSPTPAPTWPRSAPPRVRDGNDWVLNGTKMFITNGVLADVYFVAAQDRSRGQGLARHLDVHRREGHARLSVGQQARQDGLALVGHRRARVRGLPRCRRRTCSARRTRASTRS